MITTCYAEPLVPHSRYGRTMHLTLDERSTTTSLRFAVLGSMRAWTGEKEIDLGAPQQRALLALLLVRAGDPVPMHEIVDVLWPGSAPATSANIVHRYVSRLRRMLESGVLTRSAAGYRLDAGAGTLDLLAFHDLAAAASAAKATDPPRAAALLTEAVLLRRGPVAADLPGAVRAAPVFAEADRRINAALLDAAALATGRDQAQVILPALREVAAAAPFDEAVQAALVRLLATTGRAAEALGHFHAVRVRLADELGVDPSPELAAAYREVLRAGSGAQEPAAAVRPAQLPLDLASFSGRDEHVERLTGYLRGRDGARRATRVGVVVGMGGVGKTCLAVHCAHLVADRFPDGQLYVNMRGFDPSATALSPWEAVRGFLIALGVACSALPADFEAQVALFRSLTAERRMLVVLDNVRDAAQARPLLPGGARCAAIVTSRDPLSGLIIQEAALPVPLDPMSSCEAMGMLANRLEGRLAREPGAAPRIIAACGGLPLALSIFSARAAGQPHFTLHEMLAELEASRSRLDLFGHTDGAHDIRAVFSWSYRLLSGAAAHLFRLLGLHPGQFLGVTAAASLAGQPPEPTTRHLAELRRAGLIIEVTPSLFRLHDLVRAYSGELRETAEPAGVRHRAGVRLLNHYVHSALLAAARLNTLRSPGTVTPSPVLAGVTPQSHADHREAVEWFGRERQALLKLMESAASDQLDPPVWQLAWAMENYLQRRHFWAEWKHTQSLALAAASRAGDIPAQARAEHSLGIVYSERALDVPERARAHLRQAIRLFGASGDIVDQAHCLLRLAGVREAGHLAEDRKDHIEQALELYRQAERRDGVDAFPDYIAHGYLNLQRYAEALPYAERGVRLMRQSGELHREAVALTNLAEVRAGLGDRFGTLAADELSVVLFLEVGDLFMAAKQLEEMGLRYAAERRRLAARTALERALGIYRALGLERAAAVRSAIAALRRSE